MSKPYTAPKVTTVGTVAEMTEQLFNKLGNASDQFSNAVPLVGSLLPPP